MNSLLDIPEIRALDTRRQLVRIPSEIDVPLTDRVRQIIDTADFRRLAKISQLGLVALVYPAAHHTRFEHSLGVYRMALLYLRQLAHDERFAESVDAHHAERLILAALLHDLGHWPFCHPIEDMRLPGVPEHELFANSFLLEGEIADVVREQWGQQPRDLVTLLSGKPQDLRGRVLASVLSGPIDIDKMDYLYRDSLHAGVPYGKNFDVQRLIGALCLNENGDGLAIGEKGRTAAEMMVFARYVMFSEVYWHHTVRSATAMLQQAFYLLHQDLDMDATFRLSEHEMVRQLQQAGSSGPAGELLNGLFGPTRQIYKTLLTFSFYQHPDLYQQLARRPYPWLNACGERLAEDASRLAGTRIAPHEILFDAPPTKREIEFNVQVHFRKEDRYRWLGDVSPVVRTLAQQQFDDYVKRVRLFVHPRLVGSLQESETLDLVANAVAQVDG